MSVFSHAIQTWECLTSTHIHVCRVSTSREHTLQPVLQVEKLVLGTMLWQSNGRPWVVTVLSGPFEGG